MPSHQFTHILHSILIPADALKDTTAEEIGEFIAHGERGSGALYAMDFYDGPEFENRERAIEIGQTIGLAFHRAVVAGRGR